MKPMDSKIIKRDQEYPPNSSSPPSYVMTDKGYGPPTANLSIIFRINDALVNSISGLGDFGIAARYLSEVPAQQVVVSILDSKNRRQWTTSLRTKSGLEWAVAFDEKETKTLKRYFKAGKRLEVNISSLENLELNVSLVHFEPQSNEASPRLAKHGMKSKAAGGSD